MSGFVNDASSKVGSIQSFDDINIKKDTTFVNNTDLNASNIIDISISNNSTNNDVVNLEDLINNTTTLYSINNVEADKEIESETKILETGSLTKEEYEEEIKKVENYYIEQLEYLNQLLSNSNKDGIQDQYNELTEALKTIEVTEARSIYNTKADLDAFVNKTIPKVMEKYGLSSYQELVELQNALKNSVMQLQEEIKTVTNEKESAKYDYLDYLKEYDEYKVKEINKERLEKLDSESTITYTTEISDDKLTKNYSFTEYKKLYPDITPLEYYNLVKAKNKDERFIITGIEEYTTFQYLMEIKDAVPELAKRYDYLSSISQKEADEFLRKCAYEINSVKGQLEAKEFLDNLNGADEKTILAALNNEFDVHKQGIADGVVSFLGGLLHTADATASLLEKIGNNLGFIEETAHENRIMSPNEYKKLYILQALQSEQYKGLALSNNYEISQGIGNMLPSIAISALTPYGSIAMGASAGGNAYHSSMTQGNSFFSSFVNGIYSGASGAITERLFGGLPGLSDVQVTGLKTYIEAAAKEGNKEMLEGVLDSIYQSAFFGEKLPTTAEEWREYAKGIAKQGVYGAITAGYTQAPAVFKSFVINRINNRQKMISESQTTETEINKDEYVDLSGEEQTTETSSNEESDINNRKYSDSDDENKTTETSSNEESDINNRKYSDSDDENKTTETSSDEEPDINNRKYSDSDDENKTIETSSNEEPTIESKDYNESATSESPTSEEEDATIDEVKYRSEEAEPESDAISIEDSWKDIDLMKKFFKGKSTEEIKVALEKPELQSYIENLNIVEYGDFLGNLYCALGSNDIPSSILQKMEYCSLGELSAIAFRLKSNPEFNGSLIDLSNPDNLRILRNLSMQLSESNNLVQINNIFDGLLFDFDSKEANPDIAERINSLKQLVTYRKDYIIGKHLEEVGYTNRPYRDTSVIEYELSCTIDGENIKILIPSVDGVPDFTTLFNNQQYEIAVLQKQFKINSIEPSSWSVDLNRKTYIGVEKYEQGNTENSNDSRIEARKISGNEFYRIEVTGKDGKITLFDAPIDIYNNGVNNIELYKLLNENGIDYHELSDLTINVTKVNLDAVKAEDFTHYSESKTFTSLFNDDIYGGNQSDVSIYVDDYLSGKELTTIESKKAQTLINEVKKTFPNATDDQISDLAFAYAHNGCGYMAYANSLMLFFGGLENGEQIFREKFGFDLSVLDGNNKSYNVEAMAFNLFLQGAAKRTSDIDVAAKNAEGTYMVGTKDTDIINYLKSKGIKAEIHSSEIIDNDYNKLMQVYTKLANNKGSYHILTADDFILQGSELDDNPNYDSALLNTIYASNTKKVGSHGMLITGIEPQGIKVSSWKKRYKFLPYKCKGFYINSVKFSLGSGN